jgi:hypothetical protein
VEEKTNHSDGALPAEILEISDEELVREIDRQAKERLGISYEEFVEAYRKGTLLDTLAVNELVILHRFVEASRSVHP